MTATTSTTLNVLSWIHDPFPTQHSNSLKHIGAIMCVLRPAFCARCGADRGIFFYPCKAILEAARGHFGAFLNKRTAIAAVQEGIKSGWQSHCELFRRDVQTKKDLRPEDCESCIKNSIPWSIARDMMLFTPGKVGKEDVNHPFNITALIKKEAVFHGNTSMGFAGGYGEASGQGQGSLYMGSVHESPDSNLFHIKIENDAPEHAGNFLPSPLNFNTNTMSVGTPFPYPRTLTLHRNRCPHPKHMTTVYEVRDEVFNIEFTPSVAEEIILGLKKGLKSVPTKGHGALRVLVPEVHIKSGAAYVCQKCLSRPPRY
jgi:hypothetical protein